MRRADGYLAVYVGGSRMGKTAAVKQALDGHERVVIWSPKEIIDRYATGGAITAINMGELVGKMAKIGTAPARIVYVPMSMADFGDWARAAFVWGKLGPAAIVAEELADVTGPGKAPEAWGTLVRQALGWGCSVYAVTQRPSESDKTIMGNASVLHCHFMPRDQDRRYMAAEMDIDQAEIRALKPLEWIQVAHGSGLKTRGKVTFGGKKRR